MPELLLELFSEEIPARMQAKGAEDLRTLVADALVEAGLTYEGAQSHAGPRRLVLSVEGLPAATPDTREERKGPRVDAPEKAVEGFLKSAGVSRDQCLVQEDKKGAFLVAVIARKGRPVPEVVAEIVPAVIRRFPWPKSMRWGSGSLRWVRPLQSILCTFDGEAVPFAVDGISSGNTTRGHRFMAPATIAVRRFEDYAARLEAARVMVDARHRANTIRAEARTLAFARGFELVEDEALLAETAGLVEWPVVLMGEYDPRFLDLPGEVVRATIRANQKCFVLADPKSGRLANRYLLVANLIARDGGKKIVEGNDRVIAARLADARFFWDQDRKVRLEDRLSALEQITFHAKLGTQRERVERLERLSGEIARVIGADVEKAKLAARLCKADLVTEMVGEFPELQGVMGAYYARAEGLDPEVAAAIRDHYKPQGPSDSIPQSKVAQAVALADKIDTLVGFWLFNEKPTGSKDPYALRRASLGSIRCLIETAQKLNLISLFESSSEWIEKQLLERIKREGGSGGIGQAIVQWNGRKVRAQSVDLLAFFADRLKVYLREQGARYDLIDAVFALGAAAGAPSPLEGEGRGRGSSGEEATPTPGPSPQGGGEPEGKVTSTNRGGEQVPAVPSQGGGEAMDDLLLIVRRVEALGRFLDTDDGKNLLIGVKRATNILKIEEKKDGRSYDGAPDPKLLVQGEEKELYRAIAAAEANARKAVAEEDFEAAMRAIAKLRAPVDRFFDEVTVNADDPSFRENRLKLLSRIRAATLTVADFSRIEG